MIENSDSKSIQTAPLTAAEAKWGAAVKPGRFQILPDALLRWQHELGLSATDVVVIANLNQAWWFADRMPYLTPHTIAKRMGVSERTVQRSLNHLRQLGLLRQVREAMPDNTKRYSHDLSGLRRKLEHWALRDEQFSQELRANKELDTKKVSKRLV